MDGAESEVSREPANQIGRKGRPVSMLRMSNWPAWLYLLVGAAVGGLLVLCIGVFMGDGPSLADFGKGALLVFAILALHVLLHPKERRE